MKRTSAQVINSSETLSKNISYEATLLFPRQFPSTVSRTLKTKESEVRGHQFPVTEVFKKMTNEANGYVSSANLKFTFRPEYFIYVSVAL